MPKTTDARRHWRLHPSWPGCDRERWLAAITPAHPLDIPCYGQTLAPASLATIERAYGRFLNWLDISDLLDEGANPEERPTPGRLADYLRHLRELGYSGQSQLLLLSGLSCAMRILAPGENWRWIVQPGGRSVLSGLRTVRTPIAVPESSQLYKWGLSLIDRAPRVSGRLMLSTYRDGVLIALLAARPLRARTLAALEIGHHLIRASDEWRLVLEAEDMKNRRSLEVSVPKTLVASLTRYIDVVRPKLLARGPANQTSSRLWIALHGRPMAQTAVGLMIRRRAKEDLGVEFGPHRFRHAAATSASTNDPDSPALAAALLAIGARMVGKHYDRASDAIAARNFHDALAKERASLEPLAHNMLLNSQQSG